ncbi:hypothetical protein [Gorillibacterium sp. CAU 1737]|uniref:portal protein n=1 Tax=Gorillibacterium sp. CAU 1737 TaxID=3140362 RepID=UPI003260AE56
MAETKEKPIDIMDHRHQENDIPEQTEAKEKLAQRVQELFRASYTSKQALNLPEIWRTCDDYKHGRQGIPQDADDPNSCTNIIHPIIESQIADLVDKPYNVVAKPEEFSDDMYSEQVQHMMGFILDRNKFVTKLDIAEHDRLELGTCIYKTFFDAGALDGKGLPTLEPISPANFFNDPKVSSSHLLQESEFLIHAVPRPLSWFRKQFKLGKYVKREVTVPYDPNIFDGQNVDVVQASTSERALCIECYLRDDDGSLYCVTVANYLVLEDSRESKKKVQRKDKFPFVVIPCYRNRGMIWGQGDVELLIPTQDLINELDDQIRINARLMGNPQIVVGMGAGKGFDFRKWTSTPGLRVPMRDQNAFRVVEARNVSSDVPARREKAFEEADKIAGRPDVNRGEGPGKGITAASAIMALQKAGQKGVAHKARMFKDGYSEVLSLLYDEMIENWDAEMWVRIEGTEPDWDFMDPRALTNVPIMIPNMAAGEGQDDTVPLLDDQGNQITRDGMFDFSLSIGDGFPNDKAFTLQMLVDMAGKQVQGIPLVGWQELRDYIKNDVGLPLGNDEDVMPPQQPVPGMMPGAPMPDNVIPMGGAPNVFAQG